MCLFPSKNYNFNSPSFKSGINYFKCGACPECMQERSSIWALRSVMESKSHAFNCMVTLTYDKFKYNFRGDVIGEEDVNPDLKVQKPHIQKFFKRLRKKFGQGIKYIACAEYGSHTHRAHYHCILFGVRFSDAHFYKRSKRGNPIYMSKTLTDLWGHGICTIDSINVQSSIARYCTKYCSKSRSDETFMLFSQKLGLEYLMKEFNGKSYFIDGREYPVPRIVWHTYISEKYKYFPLKFSPKYVNHDFLNDEYDTAYKQASKLRKIYRNIRDRDDVYCDYIQYWRSKSKIYDKLKGPELSRIYALDESKYHHYKVKSLNCYNNRFLGIPLPAPGARAGVSRFYKHLETNLGIVYSDLPFGSRPITASDTKKAQTLDSKLRLVSTYPYSLGSLSPFS